MKKPITNATFTAGLFFFSLVVKAIPPTYTLDLNYIDIINNEKRLIKPWIKCVLETPKKYLVYAEGGDLHVIYDPQRKKLAKDENQNIVLESSSRVTHFISDTGKQGTQLISAHDDGTLKIWNLQGQFKQTLSGHTQGVLYCLKTHNKKLISSSLDRSLRVWGEDSNGDWQHEKTIDTLLYPFSVMVEFCKKYLIVSSTTPCLRGTLQVYDINQDFHPMLTLWEHKGFIKTMTATSKYVVSGTDDTLKVWDPLKGKCFRTLKGHKGHVTSLTTWNDLIISGSDDIRVWNPETGECLSTLVVNEKKPKKVRHMSTNQDGILLSCAYDGKIRYWDISKIK